MNNINKPTCGTDDELARRRNIPGDPNESALSYYNRQLEKYKNRKPAAWANFSVYDMSWAAIIDDSREQITKVTKE
ncbi:hypothetical protein KKC94_02060 [Patescibacteria group bacterium]|nr:hypothetical protein [Patescibacteria group bacterium]